MPILLFEGRHRRRAEDGAAVRAGRRFGPELAGSDRETDQADAAPAGGARNLAPGRSRPAARRHHDRLPRKGLHAAETKEAAGAASGSGGADKARPSAPSGSAVQGDFQNAAQIARTAQACPGAERREAPFSDRKEEGDAFARCLGRPRRPFRSAIASAPRFPALRSPRGSRELEFGLRRTRRRPKNTGSGALAV